MFKLIAIIEKSAIMREGLMAIFNNNRICQQTACLESMDDWAEAFKDYDPDLVLINPECVKDQTLDKVKAKYQITQPILFIALIYHYYDRETLANFTDSIYITDSEENITYKLLQLNKQMLSKDFALANDRLTEREKGVLRLLVQGLSNKEVANKLNISPHTVITHRKNIVEKTGIRSLSGLAVYAIINQITDMEHIN